MSYFVERKLKKGYNLLKLDNAMEDKMKEEELKDLEKKLWEAADKMRGAVPVSSYKFIILGLIFLKYISDSFEEKYQELVEEGYGLEEDRDSYIADNIFYVPAKARWEYLNVHSNC